MKRARTTSHVVRALLLALLVSSGAPSAQLPRSQAEDEPTRPKHVVLVIFGGGVRAKDMLDKDRMPNVAALAAGGRVVEKVTSDVRSAAEGTARLLCGTADALPAEATHPTMPTLLERVRATHGLPAEAVWFVSHEGEQALDLAVSTAASHGPAVGPSVASGRGAFGAPLAAFLERMGHPDPVPQEAWDMLRGLRQMGRGALVARLPPGAAGQDARQERVERALTEEIDVRSLLVRGPAPRDTRAFRALRTVLRIHRPVFSVLRLGEAEQASRAASDYFAVLASNDAAFGGLQKMLASDPAFQGSTLFVLLADRGRDAAPDAQGRLGASDGSPDQRQVAVIFSGAGLARRGKLPKARRLQDLAATLALPLGIPVGEVPGTPWSGLWVGAGGR
jgi:hypothetical protein